MIDWHWELITGPLSSGTEGPAWDGEALLFTAGGRNEILRFHPGTGQISVHRRHTNRANGMGFSAKGELYACQSASRRIARFNADGSVTPLPCLLEGQYLNQPNDLVVDSQGRIWFSNPYEYGRDAPPRGPQPKPLVDHGSILRLDPDRQGWTLRRITFDTLNPNGLALAPDGRTLYVAETSLQRAGIRELRAYPVLDEAGSVGPYRVLHDFGSHDHRGRFRGVDGMTVDVEGNIIACAGHNEAGPGPMVYVFSPTGRILATHPVPADKPTNCSWGGPDFTELYVTTVGGHLFRVSETGHKGWLTYPPAS